MKKSEVLWDNLVRKLSVELEKHAFKYSPKTQTFYRTVPEGKHLIHLTFIDYDYFFHVSVDVAVRYEALEELVNKHESLMSSSDKLRTVSLGSELGNISGKGWIEWSVKNENDLDATKEAIMKEIELIGLPYLERFSELDEILAVLAEDNAHARLHSPLHASRAKRAIGAAYLSDKKDEFFRLVETKSLFLEKNVIQEVNGLQEFRNLASQLAKKWTD